MTEEQDNLDEQYDSYARQLYEHAEVLGVDIGTEPYLLSIVQESLGAPVPTPWKSAIDATYGATYYTNPITKESVWEHPLNNHYRNLIDEERKKHEPASVTKDDETTDTLKPTLEETVVQNEKNTTDETIEQVQTIENFSPPKGPRTLRPAIVSSVTTVPSSSSVTSASLSVKPKPSIDSGIDYSSLSMNFSSPLSNTSDVSFSSNTPPLDFTPPTPGMKVPTTTKESGVAKDSSFSQRILVKNKNDTDTNKLVPTVLFINDNDSSEDKNTSLGNDKSSLTSMELHLDSDNEEPELTKSSLSSSSINTTTIPAVGVSTSLPSSTEFNKIQQELQVTKQELTEAKTEIKNLQSKHTKEIEKFQSDIQDLKNLNDTLQLQIQRSDKQEKQYQEELKSLERKHQEDISSLRTTIYNELSKKNEELYVPMINSLKSDHEQTKTELGNTRKETDALLNRCYNAENKFLSLENQHQVLLDENKQQKQEIQRLSSKLMNNEQNEEIKTLQKTVQEKDNIIQLRDQEIAALKISRDMAATTANAELETIKAREQKLLTDAVQDSLRSSEKDWHETLQNVSLEQQKMKEKYEVQITNLQTQLNLTKEELVESTKHSKRIDTEGNTYRNTLQELQTKYQLLQEQYEVSQSTRKILETKLETYRNQENQFLAEWNDTIQENQAQINDEKHLSEKVLNTSTVTGTMDPTSTVIPSIISNTGNIGLFSSTLKFSPSKTMNRTLSRSLVLPPPTPSMGTTVSLGSTSSSSLSVSTLSLLKECGIAYVPGNALRKVTTDNYSSTGSFNTTGMGYTLPKADSTSNDTIPTITSTNDPALAFTSSRLGFSNTNNLLTGTSSSLSSSLLSSYTPSLSYSQPPLGMSSLTTKNSYRGTSSATSNSNTSLSLTTLQLQSPALRTRAVEIFSGV